MGASFEYAVSLRITHPEGDPVAICTTLGLTPHVYWTAGDDRKTPQGRLLGGVRSESYCTIRMGSGTDGGVVTCLRSALEMLRPHRDFLLQLKQEGGALMAYIFWHCDGDTGAVFDAQLLCEMADLGVDLGINVLN